jgi:hypothetical protein
MLNQLEEIADQKTSDVGIISLRKDGIITFEPKKGKTAHTIEAMCYEIEIFKIWAGDKKLPFLSDNRNLKNFENDIRVYAQNNLPIFCNRFALIVNSGISSFLTNMFIYINKSGVPTKAFKTKEEAIKWLNSLNNV